MLSFHPRAFLDHTHQASYCRVHYASHRQDPVDRLVCPIQAAVLQKMKATQAVVDAEAGDRRFLVFWQLGHGYLLPRLGVYVRCACPPCQAEVDAEAGHHPVCGLDLPADYCDGDRPAPRAYLRVLCSLLDPPPQQQDPDSSQRDLLLARLCHRAGRQPHYGEEAAP